MVGTYVNNVLALITLQRMRTRTRWHPVNFHCVDVACRASQFEYLPRAVVCVASRPGQDVESLAERPRVDWVKGLRRARAVTTPPLLFGR